MVKVGRQQAVLILQGRQFQLQPVNVPDNVFAIHGFSILRAVGATSPDLRLRSGRQADLSEISNVPRLDSVSKRDDFAVSALRHLLNWAENRGRKALAQLVRRFLVVGTAVEKSWNNLAPVSGKSCCRTCDICGNY